MRPHVFTPLLFATLAGLGTTTRADPIYGVIDGPLDLRADVIWSNSTGATLHSEVKNVPGTVAGPKQSAEILYVEPKLGANASNRGPRGAAFASSLSESDGNGGVGVSAFKFSPAQGVGAFDQLVSQASWEQTFENTGGQNTTLKLHLSIPEVMVGLQGVAPNRSAINKVETALAQVNLVSSIRRTDGSVDAGGGFEYGMHADEYQFELGPNLYANFADVAFIGNFSNTLLKGGDDYMPTWTLGAYSTDITLGTIGPGETLSFTYQLTARGRTQGAERGFVAFVGDPFGVDIVGANLTSTITLAVPEPQTWLLWLTGLGLALRFARHPANPMHR